ncbi:Methionyl-tRNA formyltransferase [Actinomyces bovis]|uniref:Methionyl-tRNA formyltransferase n=1 Tax=Actinomyces bovis TaxID=1658 RepID=A0ABY1VQW6_9ACTO|nr:methionyl-tRNA formyltransferase [Actinomyces bovis]SPT54036.1 Methionyl-tRNA formyltransferase [Actinomyces bovis]VEG53807.1 Methionyl-tRNA formyltransferase [Actinomyces israelii]
MRILFAGTPDVALPVLQALMANSEHEVVGVLTRADARSGRGHALRPSPVAAVAREVGLDVRTPKTLRDAEIQDWVRSLEADVAVVVAYGRLVPPALLDVPRHGWLNLHFSLLPAWRGAAPVQWAVINGDEVTGACVFRLEEGLDTGPIYARMTQAIGPTTTAGELLQSLAQAGAELVKRALTDLASGQAHPEQQDHTQATKAPTLSSEDGLLRWNDPALAIDRRIRGVTPAPGAHTTYQGARLRLGPVTLAPEVNDLAPGQVRASKHEVLVGTASHAVRLGQVAPAGKQWMDADAWARGAHGLDGATLGAVPGTNQGGVA